MNALNVETILNQSVQDVGFIEDVVVPLGAWTLDTGLTIPAVGGGGIVHRAAIATSLNGICWDATATTTDIARLDWTLPGQFKRAQVYGERQTPLLQLLCKARVRDAATGSNADLALTAQVFMHNVAETSLQTLASAVSNTIGATDYADASEEGFAWYTFDLYGGMSAAQKLLALPLATLQILLAPQEAVGTSLYIDLIGTVIRYRRHVSILASSRN